VGLGDISANHNQRPQFLNDDGSAQRQHPRFGYPMLLIRQSTTARRNMINAMMRMSESAGLLLKAAYLAYSNLLWTSIRSQVKQFLPLFTSSRVFIPSIVALLTMVLEDAVDDETIKLTAAAEQQNEYASVVVDVGYNEIQTSGSSEGTRLVHFAEDTDTKCFPGQPVAENNLEPGETPKAPPPVSVEDPWWPFVSKHDWNLASWFARARCGKGSIEDYLQEPEFATRAREQKGAIKTYADLMRATYAIPYGIPGGDFWLERKIIVPGQVKGAEPQLHTVIFRPIQQCLEFLLSHKPFASDMVWAPVKKYYGISESRVYDEMHTGN